MHGPNVWPDDSQLPGWREQVQAYFAAMLELSRVIARGLSLSLSLPEQFFTDKMQDPVAQLLMLRYPPCPKLQAPAATAAAAEQQYVGCGAHTDCGFLTILAQVGVTRRLLCWDQQAHRAADGHATHMQLHNPC